VATIIVMPQMGYDMREGRVVRWLKHEGDTVARGEDLAEIETDKAVIPMTATASGVLRKVLVAEGVTVPVGQAIGVVTGAEEPLPAELEALAKTTQTPPPKPQTVLAAVPSAPAPSAAAPGAPAAPAQEVRASPLARRLAREKGIDLARITGTGPGGRVTERDIVAYEEKMKAAPAAPPLAGETRPAPVAAGMEPLSRMRQAIARLTTRSKQEIPHFYVTAEVDMTAAMALRRDLNAALEPRGVRISLNDLIIKACAMALGKHPTLNASFRGESLERHASINVGVAVDLGERGLIVPALMGCERRSLEEIARASRDLVERAKTDRLRAEEYMGATFSVSNLGMFDIDAFTAIIFPPNSAVLAVGMVRERPLVRQGQVVAAQTMHATLSVDHRVTDGAGAARFLSEVKGLLEHPTNLLA
jgi:pyruvate dehydrogenase E2 component (dihydrolipoamide acetyltransferase)